MTTLFTFEQGQWLSNPNDVLMKYDTLNREGKYEFNYLLSRIPNSKGIYLHFDREVLSLRHVYGETLMEWNVDMLSALCSSKVPALILVSAFCEMRGSFEWLKFEKAQILQNPTADNLRILFNSDKALMNVKMISQKGRISNELLVNLEYLPWLYKNTREI